MTTPVHPTGQPVFAGRTSPAETVTIGTFTMPRLFGTSPLTPARGFWHARRR
jgi:hypothetical protein